MTIELYEKNVAMSIIIVDEDLKVLFTDTNSGYIISNDTGCSWNNNFE